MTWHIVLKFYLCIGSIYELPQHDTVTTVLLYGRFPHSTTPRTFDHTSFHSGGCGHVNSKPFGLLVSGKCSCGTVPSRQAS